MGLSRTSFLLNDPRLFWDRVLARFHILGRLTVGAGSMEDAAVVQFDSTTQGFLPPRMTTTQRNAIASPPAGLSIFNTTTAAFETWDGSAWVSTGCYFDSASKTTASLAAGVTETGTVPFPGKSGIIVETTTSAPARLRLYGTAALRDADLARPLGTDPSGLHGLLLELVTTAPTLDFINAPPVSVSNSDGPRVSDLYYAIENQSGITQALTFTHDVSVLVR